MESVPPINWFLKWPLIPGINLVRAWGLAIPTRGFRWVPEGLPGFYAGSGAGPGGPGCFFVRDGISMGSEWDFTHELKNII